MKRVEEVKLEEEFLSVVANGKAEQALMVQSFRMI